MSIVRQETWGRIHYDPDWDEFEAQICDDSPPLRLDRPISSGCLVTGRCNLECEFCYGNHEALPSHEMRASEWAWVFNQVRSWGLMRVDLSGGEPTLRKDIGEIAKSAIDAGLNVVLSTNGLVLHVNGLKELPKQTRIHVSIDSGFAEVHERSRRSRNLQPTKDSFKRSLEFSQRCLDAGHQLRILTCIGHHNEEGLFELGEAIALRRIREWNISRILPAGRAFGSFSSRWSADDQNLQQQIEDMREAYPWVRIRYSNRTEQNGYFLLVLPDGTVATQYTDGRDKVRLGHVRDLSLEGLRAHPAFQLQEHAKKWISSTLFCQDATCSRCYRELSYAA